MRESFLERFGRPLMSLYAVLTILLFVISVLSSCSKVVSNNSDSNNFRSSAQLTSAIEAAIVALGAAPDEVEGEGFVASALSDTLAICPGRAGDEPCSGGVRTVRYANCTLPGSDRKLNGEVTLNFSDTTCAMSANGASVVRTIELFKQGLDGDLPITSNVQKNFKNEDVGGGTKITRQSMTSYSLEVLGIHKRLQSGHEVSLKSVTPSTISTVAGLLERNGRVVSGGTIQLTQNTNKYTVEITPGQFTYDATCCYPVSGNATLNYSGSVTGSGSVKFTECGRASVTANGQTSDLILTSCE